MSVDYVRLFPPPPPPPRKSVAIATQRELRRLLKSKRPGNIDSVRLEPDRSMVTRPERLFLAILGCPWVRLGYGLKGFVLSLHEKLSRKHPALTKPTRMFEAEKVQLNSWKRTVRGKRSAAASDLRDPALVSACKLNWKTMERALPV